MLTGAVIGYDGKTTCPWHPDWNPSLHAYSAPERGFYCYQCARGGSIYDFGAALWGITPRGRGFHDLRRKLARELLGAT